MHESSAKSAFCGAALWPGWVRRRAEPPEKLRSCKDFQAFKLLWHIQCKQKAVKTSPQAMLSWTYLILIIAVITGVLGFVFLAGSVAMVAKILFATLLIVWVASLLSTRHTV